MSTSQRSEGPIRCTWHLGTKEASPHEFKPEIKNNKIMGTILENIGNTPLVRINKITEEEGVKCQILAKCEYFNAGGSVKDRIGKRMVEDAEKSGRLKKGDTLIEPTSGNTGIGLALAAAVKGYKMIITLPEKMSQEKVDVLKGLGAQIIRTPTEAAWDSPESHIGVAKKLNSEIPNSHILDQYGNPSNPLAHYDGTGEEIWNQTDGKVDMVVLTAGTGGTITGIARRLKERNPKIKIIGVDPIGSILALPHALNGDITSYKVEGIGYDFIPTVLDRAPELIDKWYKSEDKESFLMGRRLIRSEGLLCGGSSGSAMVAAIKAAKEFNLGPDDRVVVLLPDSVRNYMTKFLNDDWMVNFGFTDPVTEARAKEEIDQWHGATIKDLNLPEAITIKSTVSCQEALDIMKKGGFDNLPIVDENKKMVGLITTSSLLTSISKGKAKFSDPVAKAMYSSNTKKPFYEFTPDTKLADLQRFFEKNSAAFITKHEGDNSMVVTNVVTKVDLLHWLTSKQQQ